MKKRISLLTAAISLLPAILLTLLAGLGLLDRADLTACDALYQQPAATDGRIVIIGIDQRALDAYGPYQEWCRDGIARTLDKFVGDCTMAIWNAPLPQEDYVMLACRAAMDMVEGARPLTEMLRREYGRTVSFGIGIHTGPAVVGNIGAPMRMDYTAIGDTVNTAARLEANAPAGTIYISRAVADALEGRIAAAPLEEPPRLKGKTAGFEILTLDAIL